jgi:leucine dehydrogenase
MWAYDDARAAIADALRLSRAMTFKSAVAGLPLGGGKGVIMLHAGAAALDPERHRAALLDFADTVEQLDGRYITAEDVGTSDADMMVIAEGTAHVTGLAAGSGDPSAWTALGVEAAIRVACERTWGTASLQDRTVSVIGLGRVGARLAELLARAGASLVVADIDESKRAVADRLGASWTDPRAALTAAVDVVAPCALGGALDHESVPALRCRVVAGAANNQLAAEPVAELLTARGILWAPDFVANAGGIINVSVELEPEGYDRDRAEARVRAIADTLRTIFATAEAEGTSPLSAALALARLRLEEAAAPHPAASGGERPG